METPKKGSSSKVLPFAIGAAAGAVAAYLITSGKGKEMYNNIKGYAGKASDLADDLKDKAGDTLNRAKEQASEFKDRAKDVIDKAKDTGHAYR